YAPNEYLDVQRDVYLFTFDRTNLEGLDRDPWMQYLDGKNPDYPTEALRRDRETIRRRVEAIRADQSVDYQWTSDYPQRYRAAQVESLVNLALGGNAPGTSGNILHTRLFYLDL